MRFPRGTGWIESEGIGDPRATAALWQTLTLRSLVAAVVVTAVAVVAMGVPVRTFVDQEALRNASSRLDRELRRAEADGVRLEELPLEALLGTLHLDTLDPPFLSARVWRLDGTPVGEASGELAAPAGLARAQAGETVGTVAGATADLPERLVILLPYRPEGATRAVIELQQDYTGLAVHTREMQLFIGVSMVAGFLTLYALVLGLVRATSRRLIALYAENQHHLHGAAVLLAGAHRIAAATSPAEVLAETARAARAATAARLAQAVLAHPDGVVWEVATDPLDRATGGAALPPTLLRALLAGGRAQVTLARVNGEELTLIAVPLATGERVLGLLWVGLADQRSRLTMETRLLELFGQQAAVVVKELELAAAASQMAALRELDRLKSEFLAAVSHELRTPLTYIYGYAELLVTRPLSAEQMRELANGIHSGARQMKVLVDDLLDLSRLEAHRLRLDPMAVELPPLLEEVAAAVRQSTPGSEIAIALAPDLPRCWADPVRLRQVVMNLLTNAVRYSPPPARVEVAARPVSGAVQVSVRDHGVGLAADHLQRIFEKFYRVGVPSSDGVKGSGLGLALCKGLVEAQGGTIWAESPGPGLGATFHFTLPLAPHASPNGAGAVATPAAAGGAR